MDLSALIFVALAVAWAVYLIPKALKHHEEDAVSRSVDKFSDRVRVLARREAVTAARSELVVTGGVPKVATETVEVEKTEEVVEAPAPLTAGQVRARRAAARRAAQRRRRVLALILLGNAVLIGLATTRVVAWPWVAIPAGLLVAWLVACRLMVRRERAARAAAVTRVSSRRTLTDAVIAEEGAAVATDGAGEGTEEIQAVDTDHDAPSTPGGWDPVPVTLPTYVAKAPAGRTVRTIDLDSTGVWSSGRNAADSALAREAEQSTKAAQSDDGAGQRRVSGA